MKQFRLSTKVWEYKKWEETKSSYAELWKLVMKDDGKIFWVIYDALHNREIKFSAFEIAPKEEKKDEEENLPF